MFHDTIRANLSYAKPGATERELITVCAAAQIWPLIAALPEGLDTIVGDRGYRLSGGEKQRIALARLLLKAPGRTGRAGPHAGAVHLSGARWPGRHLLVPVRHPELLALAARRLQAA